MTLNDYLKEQLDKEAEDNEMFRAKYDAKNRDMEKCLNYVLGEVRKANKQCLHHTELIKMARDYFNDEIDDDNYKKESPTIKVACENEEEEAYAEEHFKNEKVKESKIEKRLKVEKKENKVKKENKSSYEQLSLF